MWIYYFAVFLVVKAEYIIKHYFFFTEIVKSLPISDDFWNWFLAKTLDIDF